MIEEVTETPGSTPETASQTANSETASAEKPKVTRRRTVKKTDDATLPLDGVEASAEKPKRATRAKKVAAPDDGAPAPEKPKRVTRAKKAEAKGDSTSPAEAPQIVASTEIPPAETPQASTNGANAPAPHNEAPQQASNLGAAPLQMAPTVAMGNFTPAEPAQAEAQNNGEISRNENPRNGTARDETVNSEAQPPASARETQTAEAQPQEEARAPREFSAREARPEARGENGADESEDDFRNGRLSYRDRRALRREQRIVSRSGREEESADANRDNGARDNGVRDNGVRDNGVRDNGVRDNGVRDNRDNGARGDNSRDNGARESREVSGRDNSSRDGNRDQNRDGNRDRTSREAREGGRENNRDNRNGNREDRVAREDRSGRDNRREARENRRDSGFAGNGRRREYDLTQLEAMSGEELQDVVAELSMDEAPGEKNALIYAILEAQAAAQNAILKKGILEILPDQKGFLRCENYYPSEGDVYVSQTQIKKFGLKTGDEVLGTARVPKENERYHGLLRVESINGLSIEASRGRADFDKLTPIFPTERFPLETEPGNITARIIDLISPIGKGQRGLIVAPPKAGKTTLIKNIANSITENNPEVLLFVLLIDERPEEVTDISRSVRGEVVASTFDEVPENHIRVSDIVMERAKRLVEMGHDVVVLMDSITRLSRASNLVVAPSGRTMSGGLDPAAMYKPKRHFGAARNIEHGGSLTVLATVLVDTGSRMDDYIFEELKGTGNLDLVLDRDLFNQRIFPAIDINRSGTRRDDLLMTKDELAATFHLRRTLAALDNDKAVTLLIDRLKNTKSNANFMEVVAKSQRNSPA